VRVCLNANLRQLGSQPVVGDTKGLGLSMRVLNFLPENDLDWQFDPECDLQREAGRTRDYRGRGGVPGQAAGRVPQRTAVARPDAGRASTPS
jgi:2-(1,2-epoxy-1,2-dihydrophenyl)acetyl-CoA isomerase